MSYKKWFCLDHSNECVHFWITWSLLSEKGQSQKKKYLTELIKIIVLVDNIYRSVPLVGLAFDRTIVIIVNLSYQPVYTIRLRHCKISKVFSKIIFLELYYSKWHFKNCTHNTFYSKYRYYEKISCKKSSHNFCVKIKCSFTFNTYIVLMKYLVITFRTVL